VNEVNFGRAVVSSTAPATHWRIATTPAGPSTGKASAAGVHPLAQARQVLAAADNLVAEATTGHTRLRIAVQMIWRRHDPHPSTHAAVALLTELYRPRGRGPARP
jgi:hypothetical protein